MRALGRGFDATERVWRWPLREALFAFRDLMHERDLEAYKFDLLLWTLRGPWVKKPEKPPSVPRWMQEWRAPKVFRG